MGIDMVSFDRFLFAFTIASHILLVSVSIGLSILIATLELLRARTGDKYYGALVRKLVRPFVVSFGVGTASGIVMAVELVNLFPGFMTLVSETGVIAIFYVEIFAFFIETIFLVVFVYYRDQFKARYAQFALSLPIAAGTLLSAVLIVMVNAWMNTPDGFNIAGFVATGTVTGVNPWAPFLTVSTGYELFHAVSSVALAGTMALAAYFGIRYYRSHGHDERELFVRALRVTAGLAVILVVLAVISGILEIDGLYRYQPLKYAAIELNVNPGTSLPITLFGTVQNGVVVGGWQFAGLQGIMTGHDMLPGLSQYPQSEWPPLIIHDTFDIMFFGAFLIGLFVLLYSGLWVLGKRPYESRLMVYGLGGAALLTMLVMELGWVTDEVGRQPWIVYNVMTVSQAANYSAGLLVPGIAIIVVYLFLVPTTFWFMHRTFDGPKGEVDLQEISTIKDVNY